MKTLQEYKSEVAKKYGYDLPDPQHEFDLTLYRMLDEAAKLYAQEACREQREICAAHYSCHSGSDFMMSVLGKIKNAPEPKLI